MSLAPPDPNGPPHASSSESVTKNPQSEHIDVEAKQKEKAIELVALNRPSSMNSNDPEAAGQPAISASPEEELTGRKLWWSKWGFEVKLILALLLPVFVEVRVSLFESDMACENS